MLHGFRGFVARGFLRAASTFLSRFGEVLKTHVETNLDAADMNVRATISTDQAWFFEELRGIGGNRLSHHRKSCGFHGGTGGFNYLATGAGFAAGAAALAGVAVVAVLG